MKNIFLKATAFLMSIRWKQLVTTAFIGIIFLTTPVLGDTLDAGVKTRLKALTDQGETGRPRTTEQWQAENEALQGQPGKQLQRISQEAADAIGEMAEIYPQNAKTLTPGMDNGKLPKDD